MGGPPVMPPQPKGVWNSVYNDSKWVDATGPDRYRRAIYTLYQTHQRIPEFPHLRCFGSRCKSGTAYSDQHPLASSGDAERSGVSGSFAALARRMMKATDTLDGRLRYGARLVLSRDPTDRELATLRELFEQAESPCPDESSRSENLAASRRSDRELAALTAVASVLFNLDAALTR